MNIRKYFLPLFLLAFSTIHPEIPIDQIKGLASILKEDKQYLSPLCGAMIWNSGYVKNLYEYGDDNDPLVKLTQKLFYLQHDQVTFGPTTLPTNLATYFDEELIGKIINALENNGNVKAILTDFLDQEDVQKKLEQHKNKLENEKQLLEEELKELLEQKEKSEELKEIRKKIKSYKEKIRDKNKNIRRLKTESIAISLATLINKANDATKKDNSIFTVYDILLAMLWRKANSKQDYQKYFEQLDQSFFTNKEIINENNWLDNSGEYKEYTKDEIEELKATDNPTNLSLEDFIIYQKFSAVTKFPPLVKGTNVSYKGDNFPDCGETSLRNFFNVLLYDPETQSFNIEILRNLGLSDNSKLVKFYKKYPGISNLESHNENDPNNNAYDDWAAIVSEIPDVIYRNENICNISGKGGIKNMYVILGRLLGIKDFDFDKLEEKLEEQNINLSWSAEKDIQTNNNDNTIDFELGDYYSPLKFSWKFSSGHFLITFQEDKTEDNKLKNYINILTNINEEEVEDLEQPHKKARLLSNTSQLKQEYVIYGNYLTQICKSDPRWNLEEISKDIKLILLFLNTDLDIVMPNIFTYYSEMPTPMDVDEPEKEKNLKSQIENLIKKHLSKINFLNEINLKTIKAIIKQKVGAKFSNELKKIVNNTTDQKRLGWIAKSLIVNEYDSIPKWANSLTQKITTLNFTNEQLTTLPDWIGKLKNLQMLDLSGNKFKTIPSEIWNLKNLKHLGLYNNAIEKLPDEIANLENLQKLDLTANQLRTLPDSFGKLKNLQILNLFNNQLTTLPESFGNLKSLQTLDLTANQLRTLPDSFGKLKNLQTLNLEKNKLTTLPNSFGNLKNLKKLYLSFDNFTEKEKRKIENLLQGVSITFSLLY